MTESTFAHRCTYRIRLHSDADERAPGGAVTLALCGHWDHDGTCRWPHLSTIAPQGDGCHRLVVTFDADETEFKMVKEKIDAALTRGRLTGPDDRVSIWTLEVE